MMAPYFCLVKKVDFDINRKSVLSKGNSAQTHTDKCVIMNIFFLFPKVCFINFFKTFLEYEEHNWPKQYDFTAGSFCNVVEKLAPLCQVCQLIVSWTSTAYMLNKHCLTLDLRKKENRSKLISFLLQLQLEQWWLCHVPRLLQLERPCINAYEFSFSQFFSPLRLRLTEWECRQVKDMSFIILTPNMILYGTVIIKMSHCTIYS